jgi:hypothetical protein
MPSNGGLGDTARKSGHWAGEHTHASRQFERAGYAADVRTYSFIAIAKSRHAR